MTMPKVRRFFQTGYQAAKWHRLAAEKGDASHAAAPGGVALRA